MNQKNAFEAATKERKEHERKGQGQMTESLLHLILHRSSLLLSPLCSLCSFEANNNP
jgi:hypothetical protein